MERERLQFQGRLGERELEAKSLKLKAEGLRDIIRLYLDPFANLEDIDIGIAYQTMKGLSDSIAEYKEVLADIKAIKKALGK